MTVTAADVYYSFRTYPNKSTEMLPVHWTARLCVKITWLRQTTPRLIWAYTVCQCTFYGTLGMNGLRPSVQHLNECP